jgi:hypothetical protein
MPRLRWIALVAVFLLGLGSWEVATGAKAEKQRCTLKPAAPARVTGRYQLQGRFAYTLRWSGRLACPGSLDGRGFAVSESVTGYGPRRGTSGAAVGTDWITLRLTKAAPRILDGRLSGHSLCTAGRCRLSLRGPFRGGSVTGSVTQSFAVRSSQGGMAATAEAPPSGDVELDTERSDARGPGTSGATPA